MRYGVTAVLTDVSIRPGVLAAAAEERGFDSFYVPEHTHIPVSRRTAFPMGGALPDQYRRVLDPFVALAWAAASTRRLRVGTGVCLVAQRDAILTAKEVASIDQLSDGRFVFGVGYGWNREEMESHGVQPSQRREVLREKLLAMERLWDEDEADYTGAHVDFEPSWSWPKPVQRPRPSVLFGGAAGPTLFAHIAECGDGWMPFGGRGVAAALVQLGEAFEEAGRNPADLQVTTFGSFPDRGKLDHFAEVGVTEVVFPLPSADESVVLAQLDEYARFLDDA